MKNLKIIHPSRVALKHYALAAAVAAALGMTRTQAAIPVGASGSATQTFPTLPANTEWSTLNWAGAPADITDVAGLDAAVQLLTASEIATTLGSSGTNPPSANALARFNSTLLALQTRPTTAVKACALMATLQNTSGDGISKLEIAYAFGKPASGVEEVAGLRAYYNLTGLADSWTLIPELSTDTAGSLTAVVTLSSTWADATPLYVLWVDDSSAATGDTYTLDNVAFKKAGQEANILSFGLPGNPATLTGTHIAWYVPDGTDVTALAPTYALSYGATCVPASGSNQDFTLPVHYIVTAENPLITKDYTVTVGFGPPVIDVPGNAGVAYSDATHNLNFIVGAGNRGRLLGNFTVHWSGGAGSFSVPVDTNGFMINADTGGGNGGHVASGPISGDGSLVITHGPHDNQEWSNIYTISGDTPNTYTGGTQIKRGLVKLVKTAGVDALPGVITLGSAGTTARLVWGASDQINDLAEITLLLPTVSNGYVADANMNYLDLAGFSDRIEALTLPDDGTKTQVRTGAGGILNVKTLTVNGVVMPKGAYIAGSGFVVGTGYIDVDDFGPPVIVEPPTEPASPNPADLATTVHPVTFSALDWADSVGATSYDIYFWVASATKPLEPSATVSLSEYAPIGGVLSLTDYKWQVVAKNAVGSTPSPEWAFTTVARWDIEGEIVNPNNWIGIGNTANLIGDAMFGWQTGDCAIPAKTNGYMFTLNSGGGNAYNYTGDISGEGGLTLEMAGYQGGLWNNPLRLGGSVGNTYSGPTLAKYGTIALEKSTGNALCGAITVGSASNTSRLVWSANDQIADNSDVTLRYCDVGTGEYLGRGTFLDLNGHTDTLASLTLETGTFVQTGAGGVLTVAVLTVGETGMEPGTYTEATHPEFVRGTGSLVAAGGSATYGDWALSNAGGQAADLDFDSDGVPNGVEYFMGALPGFTPNPGVVAGKVTWTHLNPVASFEVQVSDNLSAWLPADPADIDTTSDPSKVIYTLPTDAAKKFCRLAVIP